ncbi:hypothetical protein J8M97_14385 [Gordonia polyisoprenivorans]|uniref:hypothetical protein n=1 Tax=Gordonia polyisoprenivorans TaxID=84595 RepID=UPI000B99E346|nr:hypothetical protein [Gordonia polyisoprenivorans]OZC29930.1 hypothetical protein CJJ17_25085 [Gordonia polyisoprenivorans]QUD81037.1 hypothetical protein J8M97_14385 [Gordonia polyisoprenivorans]
MSEIDYVMADRDNGVYVDTTGELTLEQCAESRLLRPVSAGRAREVALAILRGSDIAEQIRARG